MAALGRRLAAVFALLAAVLLATPGISSADTAKMGEIKKNHGRPVPDYVEGGS
jgi:hypothetical protein